MSLHLPLLVLYAAGLVGLGLFVGRRVRGAGDFFVAGRQLGPGLLFATLVAANIGAGSTVGAAGLGYRDGVAAWWWVGSAGLGSLVLAFAVGPAIRRVAEVHDLRTVGDYLEHRYHPSVRAVVSILLWFGSLSILAGQLVALAWVLQVVAGFPKWAGCLAGGLVATAYFAAGGLLTSAWVNLVQVVVLVLGFLAALPFALARAGGTAGLLAATVPPDYWSFWSGGASGWHFLALLGPAFFVSPGLLQKVYGARDDQSVRRGVSANAVVLLLFAAVPPTFGIVARALHPGMDNPELALPTVLMNDVPAAIGALGLAAVVSAEVSTIDALLFMLATSLSQDLYRRFLRPNAPDPQVLWVARLTAVAAGALGVATAVALPSVIGALGVFYTLLSVSLFVPIVAGLFWRRAGTPEALAAIGAGVAAVVAVQFGGLRALGGSPVVAGLLVSVVVAVGAGVLRGGGGPPPRGNSGDRRGTG